MAEETTEYLQQRLKKFQPKVFEWRENEKLTREATIAFEHAKTDLEIGILDKFRALRLRELDRIVSEKCYKNKDYSYPQANKWEQYHLENDYKLGLINNFVRDHVWKYALEYRNCTRSPDFKALGSVYEKDVAYQKCHDKFMKQWEEEIVPELTERAKQLFESSTD